MNCSVESVRDGTATLITDDGSILCLPTDRLPADIYPGDILQQQPDGSFLPQPHTAARRAARALTLFRKLRQSGPN